MNDLAVERVKKGAAWLDHERPGWFRDIDLDQLAMKDSCRCVLGQIWGDYAEGIIDHLIPAMRAHPGSFAVSDAFGFAIGPEENRYRYYDLDEAWIAEIKARFDAGFDL